MNKPTWWLRFLAKIGWPLALHEKATIGVGAWGRLRTEPKASIKLRVYRAGTDTWEDM